MLGRSKKEILEFQQERNICGIQLRLFEMNLKKNHITFKNSFQRMISLSERMSEMVLKIVALSGDIRHRGIPQSFIDNFITATVITSHNDIQVNVIKTLPEVFERSTRALYDLKSEFLELLSEYVKQQNRIISSYRSLYKQSKIKNYLKEVQIPFLSHEIREGLLALEETEKQSLFLQTLFEE